VEGAAAEAALVDELEIDAPAREQRGLRPPRTTGQTNRRTSSDQPCGERLCRQVLATDQEIPAGGRGAYGAWVVGWSA
jgi:hypothetical protein